MPWLKKLKNAEEAEDERFYEDLQDLLELTPPKDVLFTMGDWNAKVGSQEMPWYNRHIWPWSTEWSRAKANRVLPRECTGHSKNPLPTTQWSWIWANSRRWWRTVKPGMLQPMGSQRVKQDWVTEQQLQQLPEILWWQQLAFCQQLAVSDGSNCLFGGSNIESGFLCASTVLLLLRGSTERLVTYPKSHKY